MATIEMYKLAGGARRQRVRWRGEDGLGNVTFTDSPDDLMDARRLRDELQRLELAGQPGYVLDACAARFREERAKAMEKPVTVAAAIDAEILAKRTGTKPVKDSTYTHLLDCRRSVVGMMGDEFLVYLDVETVKRAFASFASRAPSHANKCLALLKRSLRRAAAEGQQFDHRILNIEPAATTARKRRALTWTQVEELAGSSTEPHAIRFLALTGLRISELFALTPSDYVIEDDQHYVIVRDAKTNAGLRKVALTQKAVSELTQQRLRNKPGAVWLFSTPPVRSTGWLGANGSEGGSQWTDHNFRAYVFRPAADAAELGDVQLHDLRATNATLRFDAGFNDDEMADQMGWSPKVIGEMRRLYVRLNDGHRVRAVAKLDALFESEAKREAK